MWGEASCTLRYCPLLAARMDPTGWQGKLGKYGRGDLLPCAPSNFPLAGAPPCLRTSQGPAWGTQLPPLQAQPRGSAFLLKIPLSMRESETKTVVLGSPCTPAPDLDAGEGGHLSPPQALESQEGCGGWRGRTSKPPPGVPARSHRLLESALSW